MSESVRRIAKDYAGDMIIDTKNGCFSLTVILNLDNFDSKTSIFDRRKI